MKSVVSVVLLLLLASTAQPQTSQFPSRTTILSGEQANSIAEPVTLQRHIDMVRLQKEADDLAREAQSIPTDMDSVRRGTLPKDFVLKLKQIEKLSKHLRSELSR